MDTRQSQFQREAKRQVKTYKDVIEWNSANADQKPGPEVESILQVVTDITPVSVFNQEGGTKQAYYFMVVHKCSFAVTKNLFSAHEVHEMAWYIREYDIRTHLSSGGRKLDQSECTMIENSPDQTESQETATSSVSKSFSGSVGFFGDTPTGSVGGSITASESHSFSIKDVTVNNLSNSDPRSPGSCWKFEIKRSSPQSQDFWGQQNLNWPAELSHATFKPVLVELWEIPNKIGEKFEMDMEIKTTIERCDLQTHASGNKWQWHTVVWPRMNHIESTYAPDPL